MAMAQCYVNTRVWWTSRAKANGVGYVANQELGVTDMVYLLFVFVFLIVFVFVFVFVYEQ